MSLRLTAAQALVRHLAVQWSERDGVGRRVVPALFGIFGHGNVCGLGAALEEDAGRELEFHQPKNEQSMVHTAIGFARANELLSTLACTASIGPGSTNLLTGAATATVSRVPVLLLASDTFANRRQGPVMQALEHPQQRDLTVNDALRPVSAFFDRITRPEQLLDSLPEALRVLTDPADTGAVTLSLHQDVQAEACSYPARFFEPHTWHVARRPPAQPELDRAVAALCSAQRPLVVAGGGVHYAAAQPELARLSSDFGLPVAETSAGKGALPDGELALGGLGVTGTKAANALAREADLVLGVGTRLIDLTTGSHALFEDPEVRSIGINLVARDAHKLGAAAVVGDAKLALAAICERLAARGWQTPQAWRSKGRGELERWRIDVAEDLSARAGESMSQGQVIRTLNDRSRPEDWLVVASGTPHVDVHKLWEPSGSARCLMEVGFSCMGGEIPAALGVRLAEPQAGEVYVLVGEGTYLMGGTSELVTARQYGLDLTVLVVENGGYQSIHGLQGRMTGRSFGLEFRDRSGAAVDLDLVGNARSLGCHASRASTIEELDAALVAARETAGPAVIVVSVEPRRASLASECWWDVGVAEVSDRPDTLGPREAHAAGRTRQRSYAWPAE